MMNSRGPLVDLLTRNWWLFIGYGLLAVAFAGFAFFRPVASVHAWILVFGVLALAEGLVSLVAVFTPALLPRGWILFYSVISIVWGLLCVLRPDAVAVGTVLVAAFWLVAGGLYRVVFAIRMRKAIEGEWLLLLGGVLAIVLGVLFAMSPAVGLVTLAIWIGAGVLAYGLLQIAFALRLRRIRRTGLLGQ